jgi:hypothetical protein
MPDSWYNPLTLHHRSIVDCRGSLEIVLRGILIE